MYCVTADCTQARSKYGNGYTTNQPIYTYFSLFHSQLSIYERRKYDKIVVTRERGSGIGSVCVFIGIAYGWMIHWYMLWSSGSIKKAPRDSPLWDAIQRRNAERCVTAPQSCIPSNSIIINFRLLLFYHWKSNGNNANWREGQHERVELHLYARAQPSAKWQNRNKSKNGERSQIMPLLMHSNDGTMLERIASTLTHEHRTHSCVHVVPCGHNLWAIRCVKNHERIAARIAQIVTMWIYDCWLHGCAFLRFAGTMTVNKRASALVSENIELMRPFGLLHSTFQRLLAQ